MRPLLGPSRGSATANASSAGPRRRPAATRRPGGAARVRAAAGQVLRPRAPLRTRRPAGRRDARQPKFLHAPGERLRRYHHPLAALIGARLIDQPIAAPDLDLRTGRRAPAMTARPRGSMRTMSKVGAAPGSTSTGASPRSGAGILGIGNGGDLRFLRLRRNGVRGAAEQAGDGALDGLGRAGADRSSSAAPAPAGVLSAPPAHQAARTSLDGPGAGSTSGSTAGAASCSAGPGPLQARLAWARRQAIVSPGDAGDAFGLGGAAALPSGQAAAAPGRASRAAGRAASGAGSASSLARPVAPDGDRCRPILGGRFGDASPAGGRADGTAGEAACPASAGWLGGSPGDSPLRPVVRLAGRWFDAGRLAGRGRRFLRRRRLIARGQLGRGGRDPG